MISFKKWMESMTSTGCVATFARPIMGTVTRTWPIINEKDKKKKKDKKDKKD